MAGQALEIIHLRLAGEKPQHLADAIRKSMRSGSDLGRAVCYRRTGLDTDFAILITHTQNGQSALGQVLAAALAAHGLVEHTFWEVIT